MPKVSADGINRSAVIRDYFKEHPSARIVDCLDYMKDRGLEVSYGLVATVKSRMPKEEEEITEKDHVHVRDYIRVSNLDEDVAVRILSDFADLVQVVGGLEKFRRILSGMKKPESSYCDPNEEED